MKNTLFTPYQDYVADPDKALDALVKGDIFTSTAWAVWPHKCRLEDVSGEDESVSEEDIALVKTMRSALLGDIKKDKADEWIMNAALSLLRQSRSEATGIKAAVLVRSYVAFSSLLALNLAATYTALMLAPGARIVFEKAWARELALVDELSQRFRKTYETDGLACVNPAELLALFVRVALAETVAVKTKTNTVLALKEASTWLSKGSLDKEILTAWESFFKTAARRRIETIKGFLVPV